MEIRVGYNYSAAELRGAEEGWGVVILPPFTFHAIPARGTGGFVPSMSLPPSTFHKMPLRRAELTCGRLIILTPNSQPERLVCGRSYSR